MGGGKGPLWNSSHPSCLPFHPSSRSLSSPSSSSHSLSPPSLPPPAPCPPPLFLLSLPLLPFITASPPSSLLSDHPHHHSQAADLERDLEALRESEAALRDAKEMLEERLRSVEERAAREARSAGDAIAGNKREMGALAEETLAIKSELERR